MYRADINWQIPKCPQSPLNPLSPHEALPSQIAVSHLAALFAASVWKRTFQTRSSFEATNEDGRAEAEMDGASEREGPFAKGPTFQSDGWRARRDSASFRGRKEGREEWEPYQTDR